MIPNRRNLEQTRTVIIVFWVNFLFFIIKFIRINRLLSHNFLNKTSSFFIKFLKLNINIIIMIPNHLFNLNFFLHLFTYSSLNSILIKNPFYFFIQFPNLSLIKILQILKHFLQFNLNSNPRIAIGITYQINPNLLFFSYLFIT